MYLQTFNAFMYLLQYYLYILLCNTFDLNILEFYLSFTGLLRFLYLIVLFIY